MRNSVMMATLLVALLFMIIPAQADQDINPGYHQLVDQVINPINQTVSMVITMSITPLNRYDQSVQQFYSYENSSLSYAYGFTSFYRATMKPLTNGLPDKVKSVITYIIVLVILGVFIRLR